MGPDHCPPPDPPRPLPWGKCDPRPFNHNAPTGEGYTMQSDNAPPQTANLPTAMRRAANSYEFMAAMAGQMYNHAGRGGPKGYKVWGQEDRTAENERNRQERKHKKRVKAIAKASRRKNRG